MSLWVRAIILAEDRSCTPNTQLQAHSSLELSFQRIPCSPLRPLWAPGTHAVHIHMCGQDIHTHTIKQINFEKRI